jgi:hypothetical protein
MAKKAAAPEGRGIVLAPQKQQPVWLDLMAYREVTAAVEFRGNAQLRVRVMVGRGTNEQLHIEVEHDKAAGVWDGNRGRAEGMFVIAAQDWAGVVALHGVLGAAIAKARQIGWCDAEARFHGSDAPLMGANAEVAGSP